MIEVLDNHLINQIAAGEVIESPHSVVKELVENSIDAGASRISVSIKKGGISSITITDNGVGIPKDSLQTAFQRHATSKISNVNDLSKLSTLGFRGEALPSIAGVSKLSITSKTKTEDIGAHLEIHGGDIVTDTLKATAFGTVIEVRELFFNVPVRRKYLKTPGAEGAKVSQLMTRLALGHPQISFEYKRDNKTIFQTTGKDDIKTTFFQVYGNDLIPFLFPFECGDDDIKIKGLLSKPEAFRGNRSYEHFFLHGRFIESPILTESLEDAYDTMLPLGKFPVVLIYIDMPLDEVDVNVHPTKLHVRFADEKKIYHLLKTGIKNMLLSQNLIHGERPPTRLSKPDKNAEQEDFFKVRSREIKEEESKEERVKRSQQRKEQLDDFEKHLLSSAQNIDEEEKERYKELREAASPYTNSKTRKHPTKADKVYEFEEVAKQTKDEYEKRQSNFILDSIQPVETEDIEETIDIHKQTVDTDQEESDIWHSTPFFYDYKIIGQVFSTYWIIEQDESIYFIDQHAAHERILYEEILEDFKTGEMPIQNLLIPEVLKLTDAEIHTLEENLDILRDFGFDIEEFGRDSYALRGIPYIFDNPAPHSFFIDLLDKLSSITGDLSSVYDLRTERIASMSCRAAIKGNDNLSKEVMEAMIKDLLSLENPFTCPHGRPTIWELDEYQLEKKFLRIQS